MILPLEKSFKNDPDAYKSSFRIQKILKGGQISHLKPISAPVNCANQNIKQY